MYKKIKILIVLVILFIAIFITFGIWVFLFGKNFIEGRLEKSFKIKTSIEAISLNIPLTIDIRGLKIGQLLEADRISFSPSIFSFFAGNIVLSNLTITNPVFNLELSEQGKLNLPKKSAGIKKDKKMPFYLTSLNIINGRFIFSDKKIMPEGYKTIIERININISKEMFPPTSLNTKLGLQADIVDTQDRQLGSIYGSGWIDFAANDMDATFQLKELELTYFAPYYGNFLSSRKILSAKLNTISDFKAENNDLAINTQLKLYDLVYEQETLDKLKTPSIFELAQKTLDLFLDSEGNLELQFRLNTRLDKPRLTISELKAAVLEAAVKSLANQPPQELIRKGKELIEQFKDFGKGMKDIF